MVRPWQGMTNELRREDRFYTLVTRAGTNARHGTKAVKLRVGPQGRKPPGSGKTVSPPDLRMVSLGVTGSDSDADQTCDSTVLTT
jgi:hypothetical protein